MNKTSWIIFSILTLGILALLIFLSGGSKIDVSKIDTKKVQTDISQEGVIADHVFGKVGSKVTLIEYGDFQCPYCANPFHIIIKKITEQYKNELQFVFRNFPITTLHQNAKIAAASAETAGLQGKYWEMHNLIYESQSEWSDLSGDKRTDFFVKLATNIGLNISQFKTDIAKVSVSDKINFDIALGKKDGVEGTPAFFLNGKSIKFTQEEGGDETKLQIKLKDEINSELKKAGIEIPK